MNDKPPSLAMQRQCIEHLIALANLPEGSEIVAAARYACERTIKFLEQNPDYARAMWSGFKKFPELADVISGTKATTFELSASRKAQFEAVPDLSVLDPEDEVV